MNKKTLLIMLFLLTALWISFSALQNSLPMVDPAEVGFSSKQLGKIESHFQDRVDRGEIAGIVTLVARNGKIAHISAVGYQDVEQEIPMKTNTLFRIYSMTKPIASTALMMLYQDNQFQLNDPLSKFIPEFKDLHVLKHPNAPLDEIIEMEHEPSVLDILRHTAGFAHGLGNSEYDNAFVETGIFRPETSLAEMMIALSSIPLVNQPSSAYRYSVGPDIALRLVEVISGMQVDDYLEQFIFEPLGMDDTGYVVSPENAYRLSPVHWLKDGKLVPINTKHGSPPGGVLGENWSVNNYTIDHEYKGGSLGLLSTAEDYWRFAQAVLDGGKHNNKRIIDKETIKLMTQNHLTEQQQYLAAINYQESSWDPQTLSPDIGFGLGFAIIEGVSDPGDTASKGSLFWGGAAATYFWIDPAEDIVVVAMTQHMGVDGVWSIEGELAELVYGALVERNKLN